MAEELDIQSVWKKSREKKSDLSLKINTLEKKGTKTTLYWIKTILKIEFWMNILLLPILIPFMINRGDSIWFIVLYIAITFVYLFYYQFLIRKIREFKYDGDVVKSLTKVYGYLRFFLLHYKVVIWLSMIFGLIYGLYDPANDEALSELHTQQLKLIAAGVSLIIVAVVGGAMHFLVHLIYGRKITRLKRMIDDLISNE